MYIGFITIVIEHQYLTNMLKYIYSLAMIATLVIACKPDLKPTANEALYAEVMAIHDDVMPKMKDIHRLKKEIRASFDNPEDESYEVGLELLQTLTAADESMMAWMADFKVPEDGNPASQKAYLDEQKIKITKVRDAMLTAIQTSQTIIDQQR